MNEPAHPVLNVIGVSKSFGAVEVLSDVSFQVPAGQILGEQGEHTDE